MTTPTFKPDQELRADPLAIDKRLAADLDLLGEEDLFDADADARTDGDESMNWQPIETALILYWPAEGLSRGHTSNTLAEMIRVDYAGSTPNRKPTHWMPLPAPPEKQA